MSSFTPDERQRLVAEYVPLWHELINPPQAGSTRDRRALHDRKLVLKEEYCDRLPRFVLGACPFTGSQLKRSVDPWGFDGPWWWAEAGVEVQEPTPPDAFRMLSGAMDLRGRSPTECGNGVRPGPPVPFIISRVLALTGMVAVIAALDLPSGDRIYPISYWSPEPVKPSKLHTPWLRATYWLPNGGYMVCNAAWDFDLAPWITKDKIRWIAPGDSTWQVRSGLAGCPYLDLPGHRGPQYISKGGLTVDDPPSGEPFNPYTE